MLPPLVVELAFVNEQDIKLIFVFLSNNNKLPPLAV
jgi:hypothetical protein